ncbi:MAG: 50S ribosomal protein L23 [Candidatus Ratteibacteria bacterium]|nr:50S ribosomal protein L23 [Candidatus Ratteibacteria bacterium]
MMIETIKVIKEPVITEKTTAKMESERKYSFRVDARANKNIIKRAVEQMFGVEVVKINTKVRKSKPRKVRLRQEGRTPSWKEAIVTLKKGQTIDILG